MSDRQETHSDPPQGHNDLMRIIIHHIERQLDSLFKAVQASEQSVHRTEKAVARMASQIDQMNEKLSNVANAETKLGLDIQTVVDFLKNNPNTDLAPQLAILDTIAQKLVDTDAATLANLPPTPPPPPLSGKGRP